MGKKLKTTNQVSQQKKKLEDIAKQLLTTKNQRIHSNSENYSYQQLEDQSVDKGKQKVNIFSKQIIPVSQADFDIYIHKLNQEKVYGASLIDSKGRFVYVSKIGNQQFQGSLNNFQNMNFFQMILQSQHKQLIQHLQSHTSCSYFTYLIYSKNTKRRYTFTENPDILTNQYIYYRYLKSLVSRIRSVDINLTNCNAIPGYWNQNLLKKGQKNILYFLETKNAQQQPDLSEFNLIEDPIIQKFIFSKNNKNKLIEPKKQSETFIEIFTQIINEQYLEKQANHENAIISQQTKEKTPKKKNKIIKERKIKKKVNDQSKLTNKKVSNICPQS